jgi:hypothetical protein
LIPLWRNKPVSSPSCGADQFPIQNIFPSGRQALTFCLNHAGLSRDDRVAVPEWSSHCVISAIGKVATPIPFHEVLEHRIDVSAVLLYDQWGWPTTSLELIGKIIETTKCHVLIHDMVDSIPLSLDGDGNRIDEFYVNPEVIKTVYSIFSLSKTLGLCGGGLVFCNDEELRFKKSEINNYDRIRQLEKSKDNNDYLLSFFKSEIPVLPCNLVEWLEENDLSQAFEVEKEKRSINLKKISNSKLSTAWPDWMEFALKQAITPGIVPLMRGASDKILYEKQNEILIKYQIETSVYHFNWSNNSLEPVYEKCLALPVHGMVSEIDEIINILEA